MTMQTTVTAAALLGLTLFGAPAAVAQTTPMTLGTVLTVAAVDSVPTLDTRPTCAGAAQEISVTRTIERCQRSEQEARDTLASQWGNFSTADRQTCVATTRIWQFRKTGGFSKETLSAASLRI